MAIRDASTLDGVDWEAVRRVVLLWPDANGLGRAATERWRTRGARRNCDLPVDDYRLKPVESGSD